MAFLVKSLSYVPIYVCLMFSFNFSLHRNVHLIYNLRAEFTHTLSLNHYWVYIMCQDPCNAVKIEPHTAKSVSLASWNF